MSLHSTPAAHRLISLALICLLAGTVHAQTTASAPARIRVAVADFLTTSDLGIPDAGKAVAELLLTELGAGPFQVVERSQLTAVLEEHNLSMSEVVQNPSLLGKHLQGVEYLVTGSVVKLGKLSITARLVDAKTGDIIRTAKVSAKDALGLDAAIGDLARQLDGSSRPSTMTLELFAAEYGRISYRDKSLRCGPKVLATFNDFPCMDALAFLPDGKYQPGDVVKSTDAMNVKGIGGEMPAGTTAVVVEEAKDVDDSDGKVYLVKWQGAEDYPQTVSARWIEPVQRTAEALSFQLSPWYRDRSSLRGVFVSLEFTGNGAYAVDLDQARSLEAAHLAAAADALRKICEGALGMQVQPNSNPKKLTMTSEGDFNGITVRSQTTLNRETQTVDTDDVRLEVPDIQDKSVTIETLDFLLKNPEQVTGRGRGTLIRERLELLCKRVSFNQNEKELTAGVEGLYTGIIAIPAGTNYPGTK